MTRRAPVSGRPLRGAALVAGAGLIAVAGVGAVALLTARPVQTPSSTTDSLDLFAPQTSDPAATELLRRSARAASTTPYQGVQNVSAWSGGVPSSTAVVIKHVPGFGSLLRVGEGGDAAFVVLDPAGTPSQASASEEQGEASGEVPPISTLTADAVDLIEGHYGCVLAGQATVAGRASDVVEARRTDGSVAGRLWIDHDSGLLLRRAVFDLDGQLATESFFDTITLAIPTLPAHLPPALLARQIVPASTVPHGWPKPPQALGGLTLREASMEAPGIVELVYSDGLSTLSVFEQRGRLDATVRSAWTRDSWDGRLVYLRGTLPVQVVWSAKGVVYTAVSDAPTQTLRAAVAELPRDRRPSVLERIGNGLGRIGSWIDPFN